MDLSLFIIILDGFVFVKMKYINDWSKMHWIKCWKIKHVVSILALWQTPRISNHLQYYQWATLTWNIGINLKVAFLSRRTKRVNRWLNTFCGPPSTKMTFFVGPAALVSWLLFFNLVPAGAENKRTIPKQQPEVQQTRSRCCSPCPSRSDLPFHEYLLNHSSTYI